MPRLAATATGFSYSRFSLLSVKTPERSGQHPEPRSARMLPRYRCHRLQYLALIALVASSAGIHAAPGNTSALGQAIASNTLSKPTPAPDFALQSTDGKTIRLSHLRGNLVLVNFWASWCPPCRAEMPVLDALAQSHKKAGLIVLGLNVDLDNTARDEYLKEHPVSFPILDDSKWSTAKLYIAPSQPVTFFVDRDGNLAHVHQGYKSGDDLVYAAQVRELLAK